VTFIESSLSNGEHIIGTYKLHWINKLSVYWFFLLALLLALVFKGGLLQVLEQFIPMDYVGIGVYLTCGIFLFKAFIQWLVLKKTEMGATNKRVIKKTGIITRTTEEMKITSIETVTLRQGVIGTLLNYGNLVVTGQGVSDVAFINISSPMAVKQSIEGVDSREVLSEDG